MSKENISQEFTSKQIDKIKNDFIIDQLQAQKGQ